jgi:plastocyanin
MGILLRFIMNIFSKKSLLIIFNLGILSALLLLTTNMAFAQQQQEEKENINNNNNTNSSSRSFYLFPEEIEDLEEEFFKIPHDSFSLKTMVAKKGDNITVNFYNTEANERHNFVLINQPYNIIQDLAGGQNATFSFIAAKEGIYEYQCSYHLPTMTGQLVVLS